MDGIEISFGSRILSTEGDGDIAQPHPQMAHDEEKAV
jgi:hypothetical protein